ncbi:poly-gamma-glutamate biosynthesis protein [Longimycelium tulufanense]|uniref:Poly-gamma-glutamate biosynthesis protein n=1 Tax=Longimycelium tulufanense TaxID=907463 RepID=A0A8J3C9I2_9PSEU|nr:CapA family protein [Longimycelium tulufanense]GGM60369.1 poly-gamma-glutamate biosynthesis protein [Longimycelium tulufanense]
MVVALLFLGCAPAPRPSEMGEPVPAPGLRGAAESITIVASGDVLIHQGGVLVRQAAAAGRQKGTGYDFDPVYAQIAPLVRDADLAICHLETPLAPAHGPFTGYPTFSVQPQIVDALRAAGYDTCSTASNHTLDAGFAGLTRTLDILDAKQLRHTGSFRTEADSRRPLLLDIRGVKVAQISWTYGLNGIPKPEGKEWAVNVFDAGPPDLSGLLTDAARARRAGAQIVIASVHCCTEYTHDPGPAQLDIARGLLGSPDVDLVLGHHAHVVQPFERINGKWVIYGLGNQVAEQGRGPTEDSLLARFTLTRGPDGRYTTTKAEAIPTWIQLSGGPATIVNTAVGRDDTTTPQRSAHAASYQRVVDVLNRRGALRQGLTITGS